MLVLRNKSKTVYCSNINTENYEGHRTVGIFKFLSSEFKKAKDGCYNIKHKVAQSIPPMNKINTGTRYSFANCLIVLYESYFVFFWPYARHIIDFRIMTLMAHEQPQ